MKRVITRRSALKKVAGTAGTAVAAALSPPLSRGASEPEFRVGDGQPYAAPTITWREDIGPTPLALSCAKQPGNPGCNPGPFTA